MVPTPSPASSGRPNDLGRPTIGDYGFLSDGHSAVLVDRAESVDWWCVPRFDSPSVFGRLLDAEAGFWVLQPVEKFTAERFYVGNSLVLRTVFRTANGALAVTDALALGAGERGHDIGLASPHRLLRRVDGLEGQVTMRTQLAPRKEYGRTEPHLRSVDNGVEAQGGPVRLTCTAPVTLDCANGVAEAEFGVAAGEQVDFQLAYRRSFEVAADDDDESSLEDTLAGWESWTALHASYEGAFPDEVRRSVLVLQGLTFRPSGAVVTAATTSLPEEIDGELNFDYRYAWLRDLSLTIRALWLAACPDEPARLFNWLSGSAGHVRNELIQIMYGVEGERDITEHVLEHLAGFRGSAPPPGMVLTPFNQAAIDDPDLLEQQVQSIPWKRAAEPSEIAKLALFLASADADYVTGASYVMDGGLMINLGQGA